MGSINLIFGNLIYFDKGGQGKVDPETLTVRSVTCGDGICEESENSDNCEADCPKPAPTPAATPEQKPKSDEEVKGGNIGWIILVAVIVIGVILYFTVIKKKK